MPDAANEIEDYKFIMWIVFQGIIVLLFMILYYAYRKEKRNYEKEVFFYSFLFFHIFLI